MTRAPVRRAWDAFARRFPTVAREVRNGRELVRYYRARGAGDGSAGYGAAFWDLHDSGDWPGFARVLRAHVPAWSWVDVGCGDGKLLAALRDADPSQRLLGLDPSATARARARARGITVQALDVTGLRAAGAEEVAARIATFGAAVCLEVAEHVPRWHAGKLLRLLGAAPVLVFSAAPPGQGGTLHVNEQPFAYWRRRLAARGLALSPADEAFRADVAAVDLPPWYAANVHLFVRGAGG